MKTSSFRQSMLGSAVIVAMTLAAWAAVKPGQKAPSFTAQASQAGKDFNFSLRRALAKGPVVVYFFPSAFTQGCDIEAHTFATDKAKFVAAGATIIGVSADSIRRLNAFSSAPSYCAGKFAVASDPHGRIAREYGVQVSPPQSGVKDVRGVTVSHAFFGRTTFVIGRNGRIVAEFSTAADHVSPAQHVARALEVVQHLAAR